MNIRILIIILVVVVVLLINDEEWCCSCMAFSSISMSSSTSSTRRSMTSGSGAANNNNNNNSINIGFIGCGTIAVAIATGLARTLEQQSSWISNIPTTKIESIYVTRRSASKSRYLKTKFPSLVKVVDHPQDIINNNCDNSNCDSLVLFVCVLPSQMSNVLQNELSFDNHNTNNKIHLVSLASTVKYDDLIRYTNLNPSHVSKLICLPSVARHEGMALLLKQPNDDDDYDDDPQSSSSLAENHNHHNNIVETLFQSMGGILTVSSEDEFNACMSITGVMGPLYLILKQNRDWLLSQTNNSLSAQQVSQFVIRQYVGAIQEGSRRDSDTDHPHVDIIDELIHEQTPGGLNEQALHNFQKLTTTTTTTTTTGSGTGTGSGLNNNVQTQILDAIFSRIRGISDGSVSEEEWSE